MKHVKKNEGVAAFSLLSAFSMLCSEHRADEFAQRIVRRDRIHGFCMPAGEWEGIGGREQHYIDVGHDYVPLGPPAAPKSPTV